MKVQIRSFEIKDTQAILDIINYNILNSTAIYDYKIRNFEDQKKMWEEKINKGFPVIVAERDGKLVGFGMYSDFRFREAYKFTVEHSVYISPDESGKGIGRAVCTEGLIYLKEKGIKQSILYVDDDNEAGKGLYKSLGFN